MFSISSIKVTCRNKKCSLGKLTISLMPEAVDWECSLKKLFWKFCKTHRESDLMNLKLY